MIDNQSKFKSIERVRRYLMFLSAVSVAALAYWNTSLPLWVMYPAAAVVLFTVILLIYQAVVGFAYFSYEEVGDVLIFKCYSTGNFSFKRMKISVSHADFAGYEIRPSLGKLRADLLIYEWVNDRKAAYPPLNISALTANQREQLQNALQKVVDRG